MKEYEKARTEQREKESRESEAGNSEEEKPVGLKRSNERDVRGKEFARGEQGKIRNRESEAEAD
jgi:hypothetical protein